MDTSIETTPQQPHVDVLVNGEEIPKDSALASIFDKIETGKSEGKSTQDVLDNLPEEKVVLPEKKEEPAKEVTKEAKPERVDDLEKRLGAEIKKEEEITRESLHKEPKKVEVKEEKKPEVKEEKKDEEIPDEELRPLPNDKPRTQKRISALLTKIDALTSTEANTRKEVAERDAKLKELQGELEKVRSVDPKTQDAVKQQLEELSMYRRRYDLEKDPEVKTKYDSRIESSETSIVGVLKAHQAGETLLNLIKEEGGWNKFAKSNRSVTLNDGTNVTASQLADNVMQQLPLGDRRVIDAAMVEQINTARDKDNYFKEQQQSATKFFEQREQEQQKQAETQKKNVEQVQARVQDWLKQESENNDWLKEEPVPETAEPATKAEFQERNQYKGKLKALLKKSLAETSIDGALQITKDSVQMFWEKRRAEKAEAQVEALRKQLEAKQKEIDKFHSASRTLPKSAGSLASRAASDLPEKKEFKSLEDTFDAIASGKISRSEILMNANESE